MMKMANHESGGMSVKKIDEAALLNKSAGVKVSERTTAIGENYARPNWLACTIMWCSKGYRLCPTLHFKTGHNLHKTITVVGSYYMTGSKSDGQIEYFIIPILMISLRDYPWTLGLSISICKVLKDISSAAWCCYMNFHSHWHSRRVQIHSQGVILVLITCHNAVLVLPCDYNLPIRLRT